METRRLLIAAVLSLAVLMAWQALFPPAPPVEQAPESLSGEGPTRSPGRDGSRAGQEADAATDGLAGGGDPQADEASEEELPVEEEVVGTPGERRTLRTENWVAEFDSTGARLVSMTLLHRRDASGDPVELVRRRADDQPHPFSVVDADGRPLDLDGVAFAVSGSAGGDALTFSYRGPAGIASKTFRVQEDGLLGWEVEVSRPRDWSLWFGPGVGNPTWSDLDDRIQKGSRQASVMRGELESEQTSKLDEEWALPGDGVTWASLENKYFLMAVAPQRRVERVAAVPVRALGDEERDVQGWILAADDLGQEGPLDAGLVISPGGELAVGTSYWGAKEYTRLRALPLDLEKTVRFGFFGVVSRPLLYGLRWIHSNVTPNWGWSIVLMTIGINLVLFPLRHKSFVSMQKMQKLNPRMESIRNRYRPKLRDKQGRPNLEMQRKMNEEMQGLFKEEGVNPAMGCLPLLLQMPVFFAFYRLLAEAVELQGAPWIGWITDLSLQDPYKALPLLMGATQFLQTKTMPPPANPTQRILMTTMPIWFTLFAFAFPSGLVLYWLTNNVLTIIQQAGYNRLKKAGYFGGEAEEASPPRKAKKTKSAD